MFCGRTLSVHGAAAAAATASALAPEGLGPSSLVVGVCLRGCAAAAAAAAVCEGTLAGVLLCVLWIFIAGGSSPRQAYHSGVHQLNGCRNMEMAAAAADAVAGQVLSIRLLWLAVELRKQCCCCCSCCYWLVQLLQHFTMPRKQQPLPRLARHRAGLVLPQQQCAAEVSAVKRRLML